MTRPAFTFRRLLHRLQELPPAALDCSVIWWGEERGGAIRSLYLLPEEYVLIDERDGFEPISAIEPPVTPGEIIDRMPAGTPVLLDTAIGERHE